MGQQTSKEDKKLMQQYDLDKDDLKEYRSSFKNRCGKRRNTLTQKEFREVYGELFPGDPTSFADAMFRITDADGSGQVDFMEFVRGLCLCDSKDIDEKIKIAFRLYDKDNSGTISRAEVIELFTAYSSLISDNKGRAKTMKKQAKAEKTPEDLADEFFQEMDVDNDGEVTYEEFRCAAVRNEAILSILSPQPPEWDDK